MSKIHTYIHNTGPIQKPPIDKTHAEKGSVEITSNQKPTIDTTPNKKTSFDATSDHKLSKPLFLQYLILKLLMILPIRKLLLI